jgi:hypothetical protein
MPKGVYEHGYTDLTGQTFADWTVLGLDAEKSRPRRPYWRCRCVCGTERSHRSDTLKSSGSRSCGCRQAAEVGDRFRKHGMSSTPVYKVWAAMRTRCGDERSQARPYYGARGITVDPRWESFEAFYADMGDPPRGHSLERRDNDLGYSPENCYWATHTEQMRNNRRSHYLTYQGETLTMAEWAERLGMRYGTLNSRIYAGWSIERALTTPPRTR